MDIDKTGALDWERARPRWARQTVRASEAVGGVVSTGGWCSAILRSKRWHVVGVVDDVDAQSERRWTGAVAVGRGVEGCEVARGKSTSISSRTDNGVIYSYDSS